MKILVLGQNESGKSSLINEMLGINIATVGKPDHETQYNLIEELSCKVGEVEVTVYNTIGFGDPSITEKKTMESIAKIKTVDIVLICHKLYDRIDDATVKKLKVLVDIIGNDLIDLSVLVFTFGDEYQMRCEPEYTNDGRLTQESKEEIKDGLVTLQAKMECRLKEVLKMIGIKHTVANKIPSCVTCGKRKKNGKQKELPISDNWIKDLWDLCEQRCKPEARPFVRSAKSTILERLIPVGAISEIKTTIVAPVMTPGISTVAGAAVGGFFVGGIFVGGLFVGGKVGRIFSAAVAIIGIGIQVACVMPEGPEEKKLVNLL
uniref:AIG1-type G domain-containing protein n=1 Tax=Amphimedon queenslandica TaxID=400682 RepID=A0A1X7SVF8_AMPQE